MKRSGWVLIVALSLLTASSGWSQEVRDYGTTTRGRIRDRTEIAAAQAAVDRAGADCRVTAARLRGRDASGDAQYEVACRNAPGFIVLAGLSNRALSCLAITSQNARPNRAGPALPDCDLRANRDSRVHYQRMGRDAGLACRVDEGAMVGLSPAGAEIYELGCDGVAGAWIERSGRTWSVKDCLVVTSEGGACRFTSEAETLLSFHARLRGGELDGCAPQAVRGMGANQGGAFYEIVCSDTRHLIARFDAAGLAETIPCERGSRIGDGCRLGPSRGATGSDIPGR